MLLHHLRSCLLITFLAAFGRLASAQTFNMNGSNGPFAVLGVNLTENGSCEVRDDGNNVIFTGRMGNVQPTWVPFFGTYAGFDIVLVIYKGSDGFDKWAIFIDGPVPQLIGEGTLTPTP